MRISGKMITSVAAAFLLCAPVVAQAQASTSTASTDKSGSTEDQKVQEFTAMMGKIFAAKPLTPEQQARLPLARDVVGTMTPPGFYGDMMDDLMGSMLTPLADMMSGPMAAEDLVRRQVGADAADLPELSDEQRTQIVALLDPAAKQRADALMSGMSTALTDIFRQFEAPLRDGLAKAFTARFSDAELRDIQTFFATPAGASFARQSFAVYADPQVMSASMSVLPDMLGRMPQMFEGLEKSVADLPEERGYADLSAAERQRLARLLGMSEVQLKRSMADAKREREKEPKPD